MNCYWQVFDHMEIWSLWFDLCDKMKWDFFQALAVSVLLYSCTTWTLTKCLEKKVDGNYTSCNEQIMEAGSYKTAVQPLPISQTIQARHTGHCRRNKDKLISDILLWSPTHRHMSVGWPSKTHQPCADTGYRLEDLLRMMVRRDRCIVMRCN